MKIGVIGEPCVDHIQFPDGSSYKSYGGILYSLISMSVLGDMTPYPLKEETPLSLSPDKSGLGSRKEVEEDVIIYPIFNLGSDEYEHLTGFLSSYKNLNCSFINRVEHKTRVVKLFYNKESLDEHSTITANHPKTYDREESSTAPTYPVDYEWIEPALKEIDALLINMISGVDITIDTLKKIRQNFKGYIHMDIHNIVMRTDEHGSRTRGYLPDWKDWCTNSNTLQMNASELRTIGNNVKSEEEIAEELLISNNSGYPEAIIVTRGKYGVTIYYKKDNQIKRYDEAPIIRSKSSDPTGCGDTFASAFLFSNMRNNKNYIDSLKYANKAASIKATLRGVNELKKLKELIDESE